MKPAAFDYVAAGTVEEALSALEDGDAKVLAGGQSLVPLLNMRLARPSLLVDVNRVPGLDRDRSGRRPAHRRARAAGRRAPLA